LSAKQGKGEKTPTPAEILGQEDFYELWNEKIFLGHEFLTWLFLTSEESGRTFSLPGGAQAEVWFESQLQLTYGQGPAKRTVSVTTPEEPSEQDWKEAFTAIELSKRVTKGTLRIKTSSSDWRLTLPHDTLNPPAMKPAAPKEPAKDADTAPAARFLERLASTAELVGILDGLFQMFINLRMAPEWETEELSRLQSFLASQK
jgi:hypothetical protein